jgi:holo-[acyl-carrier protein] synthase
MIGIGTDIVQIARIKSSVEKQGDRFVSRILTDAEQAVFAERNASMTFLANRFAAKEAISKALGTGIAKGVRFRDIEILPNNNGAPQVNLTGAAMEKLRDIDGQEVKVSLSDERDYAVAFAVIL